MTKYTLNEENFSPTKGYPVKIFICVHTFLHFMYISCIIQVSLIICTLKQNLKTKHSNVQWNIFKGVYFYWEKGTPQFECAMECLQRSVFLLGKKYSPIQNRTDLRGVLFSMWE